MPAEGVGGGPGTGVGEGVRSAKGAAVRLAVVAYMCVNHPAPHRG